MLNAKSFPATQPTVADREGWVLIHMANDGAMLHPMHLHGYPFEVVAQDGFPLGEPCMADTLVVAPGQHFDVLLHAVHPAPGRSTAASFRTWKGHRACSAWSPHW